MVSIVDESMEPTLADGCAVLVDLRSNSPKDRGIYVILTQDGLVVKRAVLDQKAGWLIMSDNPDKTRTDSRAHSRGGTTRRSWAR